MDVRKMDIGDSTFDVAIDKVSLWLYQLCHTQREKGTLDAMLHGSLWNPEDDVKANVGAYVDEVGASRRKPLIGTDVGKVARVLKPGGHWLYITYRQPHFLKPLLAREGVWTLSVDTLEDAPGTFEYFGFILTKICS